MHSQQMPCREQPPYVQEHLFSLRALFLQSIRYSVPDPSTLCKLSPFGPNDTDYRVGLE